MPRLLEPKEQPNGSLFFDDLKDDVRVLAEVVGDSKSELQFIMWREFKNEDGELTRTVPLPPQTGPHNKAWFRKQLVDAAKDGFGAENVPNIVDEIDSICTTLTSPAS